MAIINSLAMFQFHKVQLKVTEDDNGNVLSFVSIP